MASRTQRTLIRQIDTLFNLGAIRDLTDGQLLERYTTGSGEAAELAFAALVERHAAMVLHVCGARLDDPHDAQDATQATFLILARKSRSLWVRDSLGPWLHQVASRTSRGARAARARREAIERRAAEWAPRIVEPRAGDGRDLERALHEEIDRLPECFRLPIVLCDLQGHTCEEAARRMGRPVGTIKSWRSRGRDRLRSRLVRRGLAPGAVLAAGIATADAGVIAAASRSIAEQVTAGTVPARVVGLVNGVLKAMLLSKIRAASAALGVAIAVGFGLGAVAWGVVQDGKGGEGANRAATARAPAEKAGDVWELSLHDAIRIGLKNSEAVRVIQAEGQGVDCVIARRSPDMDDLRFRAEITAHVRSVEQQYWALQLQRTARQAAEAAVELGEQIAKREEAKAEGVRNNLAEAHEQLERFRMALVDKTSELITTERQLRFLLGLSLDDRRRIVPTTAPLEAAYEPEWERSHAAMLDKQPDVLRARSILDASGVGRVGPETAKRRKGEFDEAVHRASHALARFFLEVDSNYKLYATARRLRGAAKDRLDAQAAFYEGGKVTIDRYLDAVNRLAAAETQEAEYRSRYNTAIAALYEAEGTLLEHDGIGLVDGPKPEPRGPEPSPPAPGDGAILRAKHEAPDESGGKTVSFRFTVGFGPKPLEITGSFTVAPARPPEGR